MQTVRITKTRDGEISHTTIYEGFGANSFHMIKGDKIDNVCFGGYSCQIQLKNGKTLYITLPKNPNISD